MRTDGSSNKEQTYTAAPVTKTPGVVLVAAVAAASTSVTAPSCSSGNGWVTMGSVRVDVSEKLSDDMIVAVYVLEHDASSAERMTNGLSCS
jgi:hypothetical protein